MKAKVKRLLISQEFFPHLFREGTAWRVYHGLPENVVVKGWCIDPHNQVLTLFVSHDSFEEVDVYHVFPEVEMEFLALK
jgi:hypothetical protein